MRYSLDSSICIALLRDHSTSVARRFERAVVLYGPVSISSLVLCELWYGVYKSLRPAENMATLRKFLRGPVEILQFDEDDAQAAAEIRAALAQTGRTIGSYDTLIAGQALAKTLTVVTSNLSEFERVKGLRCQNWAK